ncbi:GntR family transcriptional regulator [Pseudomonas chlororaphis]|nr:GntR family transcriptional regulator [Pseudomonas chlororaphis]MBP5141439.1 GntR family transcriptional regulator [Pseudomonas chlororaphis]QTU03110.1 GntR family transcriptional regulator [Pseudomonas chlororaphis]
MTHLTEVLVSEALEPRFARDEIARRVAAAIADGRLPEGTPIRQQCLADLYGVSRMPVREALRQLESQGLLASDEYKSMRVAGLTPNVPESSTLQAERDALHQRLNTTGQRVDELEGLLRNWLALFSKQGVTGGPIAALKERTIAALKPTAEAVSHE